MNDYACRKSGYPYRGYFVHWLGKNIRIWRIQEPTETKQMAKYHRVGGPAYENLFLGHQYDSWFLEDYVYSTKEDYDKALEAYFRAD